LFLSIGHLLLPSRNFNRKYLIVNHLSFRTKHANDQTVQREWWIVDAENQTLGRTATRIASLLIGKHKPSFTKHVDTGDHVVVINAGKIRLTGNKMTDKKVITYTGYPGGQKVESPKSVLARKPTYMLEEAVRGMLPKTRLGAAMYRKLHVYADEKHDHVAQKPKPVK
jgi:large subunit ribosomal protein L13